MPPDALIQHAQDSNGDRHLCVVYLDNKMLYEMYRAFPDGNGGWEAEYGAIFDLKTNTPRPDNWPSADAARLPIYPATHQASTLSDLSLPPIGARLRLKASYDISGFTTHV